MGFGWILLRRVGEENRMEVVGEKYSLFLPS